MILPLACHWYCGVGTLAMMALIFIASAALYRRIRRRHWLKIARAYRAERKTSHV